MAGLLYLAHAYNEVTKGLRKMPNLRKICLVLFCLINACNEAAQAASISANQAINVYFNSSTQIAAAISNGNKLAFVPSDPSLGGDLFTVSQLMSLINQQVVTLATTTWAQLGSFRASGHQLSSMSNWANDIQNNSGVVLGLVTNGFTTSHVDAWNNAAADSWNLIGYATSAYLEYFVQNAVTSILVSKGITPANAQIAAYGFSQTAASNYTAFIVPNVINWIVQRAPGDEWFRKNLIGFYGCNSAGIAANAGLILNPKSYSVTTTTPPHTVYVEFGGTFKLITYPGYTTTTYPYTMAHQYASINWTLASQECAAYNAGTVSKLYPTYNHYTAWPTLVNSIVQACTASSATPSGATGSFSGSQCGAVFNTPVTTNNAIAQSQFYTNLNLGLNGYAQLQYYYPGNLPTPLQDPYPGLNTLDLAADAGLINLISYLADNLIVDAEPTGTVIHITLPAKTVGNVSLPQLSSLTQIPSSTTNLTVTTNLSNGAVYPLLSFLSQDAKSSFPTVVAPLVYPN